MAQGQIGIIVFVIIALLSAILFHYKWDSFWISSVLAAVVASTLFQVVGYFILGYLDPFFMIAFTISLAVSFIVSVVVGLSFTIIRKKRKNKHEITSRFTRTGAPLRFALAGKLGVSLEKPCAILLQSRFQIVVLKYSKVKCPGSCI